MNKLPDDILAIIHDKTSISEIFMWAMACVKVAPNIKNYLLRNRIGLFYHVINERNDKFCQYLIDIGWKITVNHLSTAAFCGNIFAFDKLSDHVSTKPNIDVIINILCCAINSQSPYMVGIIMYTYNLIPRSTLKLGIILPDYRDKNIEKSHVDQLMHVLGKNFTKPTFALIKLIVNMGNYILFTMEYGYLDLYKAIANKINYEIDSDDVSFIIEYEHYNFINYLSGIGYTFDVDNVGMAIDTGNIELVQLIIMCGANIPARDYIDLQISAIEIGIEMFELIYNLCKIRDIKVSREVFSSDNIEFMEFLHKHKWPISDEWSYTGLKYMHEHMGIILTQDMRVKKYHPDFWRIEKYLDRYAIEDWSDDS